MIGHLVGPWLEPSDLENSSIAIAPPHICMKVVDGKACTPRNCLYRRGNYFRILSSCGWNSSNRKNRGNRNPDNSRNRGNSNPGALSTRPSKLRPHFLKCPFCSGCTVHARPNGIPRPIAIHARPGQAHALHTAPVTVLPGGAAEGVLRRVRPNPVQTPSRSFRLPSVRVPGRPGAHSTEGSRGSAAAPEVVVLLLHPKAGA